MLQAGMTPLAITAGYVEFDFFEGSYRKSVVIKRDVVEEHALRHPMNAIEIQAYIAENFDIFSDAIKRAGAFNRRAGDVVVIDRIDELEPIRMRRFG